MVMGMNQFLHQQLKNAWTVYSRSGGINPAVAQRRVLLALPGVSTAAVDEYLLQREENTAMGLSSHEALLVDKRYLNKSRGRIYTVYVEATKTGHAVKGIAAVVRPVRKARPHIDSTRAFEIIAWNEAVKLPKVQNESELSDSSQN